MHGRRVDWLAGLGFSWGKEEEEEQEQEKACNAMQNRYKTYPSIDVND